MNLKQLKKRARRNFGPKKKIEKNTLAEKYGISNDRLAKELHSVAEEE